MDTFASLARSRTPQPTAALAIFDCTAENRISVQIFVASVNDSQYRIIVLVSEQATLGRRLVSAPERLTQANGGAVMPKAIANISPLHNIPLGDLADQHGAIYTQIADLEARRKAIAAEIISRGVTATDGALFHAIVIPATSAATIDMRPRMRLAARGFHLTFDNEAEIVEPTAYAAEEEMDDYIEQAPAQGLPGVLAKLQWIIVFNPYATMRDYAEMLEQMAGVVAAACHQRGWSAGE
ncbi:MAG: hypothetical protein JO001_20095 [Alphaproteobacteria bacterium]|nr:hypothetical protein [Alphaproteobacteria bacterium]